MARASCWAVVPAGGSGDRFSPDHAKDKLLQPVDGSPMLLVTVRALMAASRIDAVIIAAPALQLALYGELLGDASLPKPFELTEGGPTRRASVFNALQKLPIEAGLVAVHDAARPLIDAALIDKAVNFLEDDSALGVVVSLPVHDTVKRVSDTGDIIETLDRNTLWCAQTPQVFWTEILLKAHRTVPAETPVTDDAQLLELAKLTPVKLIEGSPDNLKVTTPDDLALAEMILRAKQGGGLGEGTAPSGSFRP